MADPNQAVFDAAFQTFSREVVASASEQASKIASDLRKEMDVFVSKFYADLIDVYLPQLSPDYADYGEGYFDRKARLGKEGSFYDYKGKLLPWLRKRDALKDFGRSRAAVSLGDGKLKGGFERAGQGYRDLNTGQFASRTSALSGLKFTVDYQIFPKLDDVSHHRLFDIYGHEKMKRKFRVTELGHPRNPKPRELLLPSLLDYRNNRLPQIIQSKFGLTA